jgi:diguanylate cyclase (GGDEF)-like protein
MAVALERGKPAEYFSRLRRRTGLMQPFGRPEADRIVRVSYVYDRYFKSRNSRYVRAMLIHYFADSKSLDGDLFAALSQMLARVRRGKSGTVLLFDVDGFGSIVDCLGQAAADRVLTAIDGIIESEIGTNGVAGRFGGDEFLVVSEAAHETAMRVAHRVGAAVAAAALDAGRGKRVTVSAGVTFASRGSNVVDVVEYAAHALRLAKDGGKNCVVAWPMRLAAPPARHATMR